jgi:cytosine/adenosine deaminase-related metal-dependent hydrolase
MASFLLRARVVLPMTQSPIENGGVLVRGDRISAVGRWKEFGEFSAAQVVDLGETVLLPGLINSHCHLDYTDMAGQITRPKSFPDWIKELLALKAQWSYSDYAQSWLRGAKMLLQTGTTSVADIEAVPELLPEVWSATPLRIFSFLEMTGVKSRRSAWDILHEAVDKVDSLPPAGGSPGLSPHAPYSTSPELIELSAELARQRNWRITTHVSESLAEFEMFMHRRGPLFNWLKNQRSMSDCGLGSPIQHLERHGLLGSNLLAVHVNYLGSGDAFLLGQNQVSVVHCPRSHFYFQHDPFPRQELTAAGVNVCLGTDSLVSVQRARRQKPELDLFAEMRAFAAGEKDLRPETILQMVTVNAARALGMSGKIGEITEGSFADLIAVPVSADIADTCEAVLHHSGKVSASMIKGQWAVEPV